MLGRCGRYPRAGVCRRGVWVARSGITFGQHWQRSMISREMWTDVINALLGMRLSNSGGVIEEIGIECLVGDQVVFEESSEIWRSTSGEQESVNGGAEKLKSRVYRSEDGSSQVIIRICVVDSKIQT